MKRCDCVRCKNFAPCESATGFCDRFEPTYQTNADHIRAVSDEELAGFLERFGKRGIGMTYKKANRMLFDIICIIAIIIFPYFILEWIGMVDYVKENRYDGE